MRSSYARLPAALMALLLVAVACDQGFGIDVVNPCDHPVTLEYRVVADSTQEPSVAAWTTYEIKARETFLMSGIGDHDVVLAVPELGWEDRETSPNPGGTIVFEIDPALCLDGNP